MNLKYVLRAALAAAMFVVAVSLTGTAAKAAEKPAGPLRVATFDVDATPPLGSPVAYTRARKIDDPLSARGIILLGAGKPIVLCAVDWIGIGNSGHQIWREQLAEAAGTTPDRVAVHVLHQHDGPRCDFSAEELLTAVGSGNLKFDAVFARQTIKRASEAIRAALDQTQPITHIGVGQAKVDKVASNRRILGPDGKVQYVRPSSSRNPILFELPEGLVDPYVKIVSLWNGDQPVVCLSYYACHPQSYYGQGDVTCEFIGIARNRRQEELKVPHVHFNGAGGNVAAGKYNDGAHETRKVLTSRFHDGLRRAWEATKKQPLAVDSVEWRVAPVNVPVRDTLVESKLTETLKDESADIGDRARAATKLAFLDRRKQGIPIELACLKLGDTYILHMPGELFVEYQLAAQKLRPNDFVCMAAYGDYGTGYIGTEIAYSQGGYETGPNVSNTAPQIEKVLMDGVKRLLQVKE